MISLRPTGRLAGMSVCARRRLAAGGATRQGGAGRDASAPTATTRSTPAFSCWSKAVCSNAGRSERYARRAPPSRAAPRPAGARRRAAAAALEIVLERLSPPRPAAAVLGCGAHRKARGRARLRRPGLFQPLLQAPHGADAARLARAATGRAVTSLCASRAVGVRAKGLYPLMRRLLTLVSFNDT